MRDGAGFSWWLLPDRIAGARVLWQAELVSVLVPVSVSSLFGGAWGNRSFGLIPQPLQNDEFPCFLRFPALFPVVP